MLSNDDCLLTGAVDVLGETAQSDLSGFGSYGDDPSAEDAYRHVCRFRGDELSVQLQLIRVATEVDAQQTVDLFLDQASNGDQENAPTTVQVDGVDVHVNHRWYPEPEYGEAMALLHDPTAGALLALEVSSLDADQLEAYAPQQVAADLLRVLATG